MGILFEWPRCRVHRRQIEYRPDIEVGSPWVCPECGPVHVVEEDSDG